MKATYIQPGDTLDYTNPTERTIEAGTVVVFGTKAAVAAADIPAGEIGAVTLIGAWEIPKDTSAITAGAAVYYDAENDKATTTASGNTTVGTAIADAGADATTVIVRLNG